MGVEIYKEVRRLGNKMYALVDPRGGDDVSWGNKYTRKRMLMLLNIGKEERGFGLIIDKGIEDEIRGLEQKV